MRHRIGVDGATDVDHLVVIAGNAHPRPALREIRVTAIGGFSLTGLAAQLTSLVAGGTA